MENRKETLKDWIRKQRLSNYGYDYKDFQKMQQQKVRWKKKVLSTPESDLRRSLAKAGILGKGRRLGKAKPYKAVTKGGKRVLVKDASQPSYWRYDTGQSFNEELLNILRLGATKGKKGYWE